MGPHNVAHLHASLSVCQNISRINHPRLFLHSSQIQAELGFNNTVKEVASICAL
jgi:hypothetical protein